MPQIPAEWEETTLGEVVNIQTWKWIPSSERLEYWKYEIIGANWIIWYTNSYLLDWEFILTWRVWTIWEILYKVWKFHPSDNVLCISEKKNVSIRFLSYYLKTLSLKTLNCWSTQPLVTQTQYRNLPIHLPPLPEQQAIAAVLSSFDDKIELLRAENQTLEQMGQELFKERFGKWKVGDELPEGWRVGKLGEIISLQWWFVHNINLAGWEKTKIAKMWVVDGKVFFNRNSVIWYPDIIPEKYKLEEWDLIICTRDVTQDRLVIWNVALVPDDLAKFWLYAWSNTWIVKTSFHKLFLFLLFRSRNFRNHIIQSAKGSTIVMITQDAFLYTNIIIPDQETLSKFDLVIKPLFNKIRANSEQIQSLSATRDQLLPKLMSWEMRVEF